MKCDIFYRFSLLFHFRTLITSYMRCGPVFPILYFIFRNQWKYPYVLSTFGPEIRLIWMAIAFGHSVFGSNSKQWNNIIVSTTTSWAQIMRTIVPYSYAILTWTIFGFETTFNLVGFLMHIFLFILHSWTFYCYWAVSCDSFGWVRKFIE